MRTELRMDIHDIAPAIILFMAVENREYATQENVRKQLPKYLGLPPADARLSTSRTNEKMWQTTVRNVARAQNITNPKMTKYPPCPGCDALEYQTGDGGRFILHYERLTDAQRHAVAAHQKQYPQTPMRPLRFR